MARILCSCCEAEFVITFDDQVTEGEIIFCPFCSEKLYLKDEVPRAVWDDEDEELSKEL